METKKETLKKAFNAYRSIESSKYKVIVKESFSIGIERVQEKTFNNEKEKNTYIKTLRSMNPSVSILQKRI